MIVMEVKSGPSLASEGTLPKQVLANKELADLHDRAIGLWIAVKERDPDVNPAEQIFLVLTGQPWPAGVAVADNTIELCSILNESFGAPPLSDEERRALNVRAFLLAEQHSRGLSPIRFFGYLRWANSIGYAVALASLLLVGFSWWVLGLSFAVWSCFGAARAAARMRDQEPRPDWELPAIACMHLVALLALYAVSVTRLFT